MARGMHGTEAAIYRAVITHVDATQSDSSGRIDKDAHVFVEYAGPFIKAAPATAVINSTVNAAENSNAHQLRYARFPGRVRSASGHVERAELKWEAV